jgi:hypothetical protein
MIELNPREAALMDQGNHDSHHQSKQSRSQVKMQLSNTGCRPDTELANKPTTNLPGKNPTKTQRELVFSRKSYRFYDGKKISLQDILNVLNSRVKHQEHTSLSDLSYNDFGEILRYFGQYLSEKKVITKIWLCFPRSLVCNANVY